MRVVRWLFGSEQVASSLAHKAVWTAVQSGTSLLLADGLLGSLDVSALQTVGVSAVAGALVVVKEFARKQVSTSGGTDELAMP